MIPLLLRYRSFGWIIYKQSVLWRRHGTNNFSSDHLSFWNETRLIAYSCPIVHPSKVQTVKAGPFIRRRRMTSAIVQESYAHWTNWDAWLKMRFRITIGTIMIFENWGSSAIMFKESREREIRLYFYQLLSSLISRSPICRISWRQNRPILKAMTFTAGVIRKDSGICLRNICVFRSSLFSRKHYLITFIFSV